MGSFELPIPASHSSILVLDIRLENMMLFNKMPVNQLRGKIATSGKRQKFKGQALLSKITFKGAVLFAF